MSENQSEYKPGQIEVVDRRFSAGEVAVRQSAPTDVIMAAIQKGYQPEFIERMMTLQERFESNEARKAYHLAMSEFKADPPEIDKDKLVSFQAGNKTMSYSHASLANVTSKINRGLSEHGLSAGWETKQDAGTITVTCTITHRMGHSESTSLTAAPDTSGSKNAIQAVGSTISYLERYTILALTGLATHDQDDDGNSSGAPDTSKFDEWSAMCNTAGEGTVEDVAEFWKKNGDTIKNDLTKPQAAEIYRMMIAHKKRIQAEKDAPEPGSDG